MSYDYLKGHKCMAWTFMGNSRMYQALAAYGDRLSQVGLFSFKVSRTGIITESGVAKKENVCLNQLLYCVRLKIDVIQIWDIDKSFSNQVYQFGEKIHSHLHL